MSLYKRGDVWWYKFRFAGQVVRESSKSESKTVAKDAERARRRELEESWNQIKRRKLPPLFSVAAADWLKTRTGIAPTTERSYRLAISHLTEDLGKQLLCDISAEDLAAYQTRRKREGVSNRTVNLELGVLRSILRRYRMWEAIAEDVDFLKETPHRVGRSPQKKKPGCSTQPRRADAGASTPSSCWQSTQGCERVRFAASSGDRLISLRTPSQWARPRRLQAPDA